MGTTVASASTEIEGTSLSLSLEAWYEHAERQGIGDGLPLVPPTPERVEAMIDASGRRADELVAVLAPKLGAATVEKIAINAVMAGCRPEYLPVVIAAVEATSDPVFKLELANTTTNCPAPFLVINGPDRDALGVNYRESCFGMAGRANATIGRAVGLVQLNIGGAVPGKVSKSVFGQPGRYSLCIGEHEEANPWEPLHVNRGFRRDQNAVTLFSGMSVLNVTDVWSMSGETYLHALAKSIDIEMAVSLITTDDCWVIVLCPMWAQRIADDGFSRQDVQRIVWERSRIPLDRFTADFQGPLRDQGSVSSDDLVPLTDSPDRIWIVVAGGTGGLHAKVIPSMNSGPVTRAFETVTPT